MTKPSESSRRTSIGKPWVKDHSCSLVVRRPARGIGSFIQFVGFARAATAIVVVVERQRRVIIRVANISLRAGKVAGVVGAAVDAGIGAIHMGGIVGRALAANETVAVLEHVMRAGESHVGHLPTLSGIDGLQSATAPEHVTHVDHLCGVETAQLQDRQFIAAVEHPIHTRHLAGVQEAHSNDGFEVTHFVEPVVGRRRADIGERVVKGYPLYIGIVAIGDPTGFDGAIVQVIGRAYADTAPVVIAERQGIGRRRVPGIGLLGSDAKGARHGRQQDDQTKEHCFFHIISNLKCIKRNPLQI